MLLKDRKRFVDSVYDNETLTEIIYQCDNFREIYRQTSMGKRQRHLSVRQRLKIENIQRSAIQTGYERLVTELFRVKETKRLMIEKYFQDMAKYGTYQEFKYKEFKGVYRFYGVGLKFYQENNCEPYGFTSI